MAEQLFCKQLVGGSIPFAGSQSIPSSKRTLEPHLNVRVLLSSTTMRSRFLAIALAAVIVLVAAILWLNSKGGGGLAKVPGLPQARLAPALVQVENGPESHPQAGLQKADVAYEYLTEGGITRFTLVYNQPSGGDRTEPVRSARLVTLKIQHLYQGVIFYSGA